MEGKPNMSFAWKFTIGIEFYLLAVVASTTFLKILSNFISSLGPILSSKFIEGIPRLP